MYFCGEIKLEARGQQSPYFFKIPFVNQTIMIAIETIVNLIEPYTTENNLELVEVKNNKANNIKIFINTPDRAVDIEDCVKLSRFTESVLDRDIEDYSLMVSSAGVDNSKGK